VRKRGATFYIRYYAWDPENPLSGRNATIKDLTIHASSGKGSACAA